MDHMMLQDDEPPERVYVILRVFDLLTRNRDLKIFVDPLRLRREYLDFEVQQWIGKVL